MIQKAKNDRSVREHYLFTQVAYETELSGTPTAVFTEIQLIGQFLVLGIIVLI